MKLEGKVAIVTGGGSGQGRAIAQLFAAEGASVVVADVNAPAAEETAKKIREVEGSRVRVEFTDVGDEAQVKHLVEHTVAAFGGLDILVNCAGRNGPFDRDNSEQLTLEDWDRSLKVNLLGPWLCIKYAAPVMRSRGGGAIVNVGSIAGLRPFPGGAPYCCSKAALLTLTKIVAVEYVSQNIRANAIIPGHVDTPMMDNLIAFLESRGSPDAGEKIRTGSNPMKRLARPDEVASVALFLAAEDSSFVTGTHVLVDGGYMAG